MAKPTMVSVPQTEINQFNCEQEILKVQPKINDAMLLGNVYLVQQLEDQQTMMQDELVQHKQAITGVFAEIDELDKPIAEVVARLKPLYTDPSLEEVGAMQRKRIEDTDAYSKKAAPWKQSSPRGRPFARGPKEVWEQVLPVYELERGVREVVARMRGRAEAEFLQDQQDRAADKARFDAGLAPELGNGLGNGAAAPGA